jgi:ribosomal protein S18 acetylase RimI-like enzyme
MRFRKITQADVPACFAVRVATRENTWTREQLAEVGIDEQSVSAMLETTHRGWLCEADGRIVGFAMGNHANGEMWVVAVLPSHEGKGIGAGLLARVEDWLWSKGWAEIWLETDVDSSLRAYGFYKSQGWVDREIRDRTRYMRKSRPNNVVEAAILEIRRYLVPDHDEVWRLHNEALTDTGAHAGNGPWDDDLHRIEEAYLDAGGEFLVGVLQGRIIAMGALKPSPSDRAEITRMRVHPDFQRRGFGQRVLEELERRARALGKRTLHLDTTEEQTAARCFYEKNGYREIGRERRGGFQFIFFEKQLASEC